MKYGKDFNINGTFMYNFSGFSVKKANYIIKMDNYPNPAKCRLFRTEKAAIRFFKSIKDRWIKVYEKVYYRNLDKHYWHECFYEPMNDRFYSDFGSDVKIEE